MKNQIFIKNTLVLLMNIGIGVNFVYSADIEPVVEGKMTYENMDAWLKQGRLNDAQKTKSLWDACKKGDADLVELLLKHRTVFKDFEMKSLERTFKKNEKEFEQKGGSDALKKVLEGQFQCINLLKKEKEALAWENSLIKSTKDGDGKKVDKLLVDGEDFFYKLNDVISNVKSYVIKKKDSDKNFAPGEKLYDNIKASVTKIQQKLDAYIKLKRESFALRSRGQREMDLYTKPDIQSGSSGSDSSSGSSPRNSDD